MRESGIFFFMEFTFCALNVISNLINFFLCFYFNRMREGQKNLQEAQDQERRKRDSSHDSITKGKNIVIFCFNLNLAEPNENIL